MVPLRSPANTSPLPNAMAAELVAANPGMNVRLVAMTEMATTTLAAHRAVLANEPTTPRGAPRRCIPPATRRSARQASVRNIPPPPSGPAPVPAMCLLLGNPARTLRLVPFGEKGQLANDAYGPYH